MGSFAAQDLGSLGKTALNVSLLVLKSALFSVSFNRPEN